MAENMWAGLSKAEVDALVKFHGAHPEQPEVAPDYFDTDLENTIQHRIRVQNTRREGRVTVTTSAITPSGYVTTVHLTVGEALKLAEMLTEAAQQARGEVR